MGGQQIKRAHFMSYFHKFIGALAGSTLLVGAGEGWADEAKPPVGTSLRYSERMLDRQEDVTGKVGNANFKEDLFYGDDARGVASLAFGYVSCTPEMVTARGDLLMVKIKPRAEREEPGVGSKRSLEVLKALNGGVDVELASDDDEDADEDAAPATTTTAGGYDPSIFVPPPEEEPAAKRSRREPSAPPSPPLAEEVAAEDGADVPEAVAV